MKPSWYFLIFWNFFPIIFVFSNSGRVETDRNEKKVSLFFGLSRSVSAWNETRMMSFNILNFFAIIFEFSNSGWVEMDRNEILFFSLFFGQSRPISVWNEAWMMFFNFKNFFAIIFEFFNSGRVETDWNEIFFPYFLACPNPFWLEMEPGWCFLIFWILLLLFLNFLTRVE